jgi:CheY-like chemotaxis protein
MCDNKQAPCILVVDDKADALEIIRMMLESAGYSTEGAATAGETINRLDELCGQGETCPDLLILDIDLPDVKGGTLAKWVRQVYPMLPIIFLTAYGRLPAFLDIAEALRIPLETKPVDPERFIALIAKTVRDYSSARMVGTPLRIPPIMAEHIRDVAEAREGATRASKG